jgi:serine/threonine protein kinase
MFELQEKLGRGSYGEVYQAKRNKSDETLAIKIISLDDNKIMEDVR